LSGQKTVQFNVTDLTAEQRRALFVECMNQRGFEAFIKNENNQQVHYTFQYKG